MTYQYLPHKPLLSCPHSPSSRKYHQQLMPLTPLLLLPQVYFLNCFPFPSTFHFVPLQRSKQAKRELFFKGFPSSEVFWMFTSTGNKTESQGPQVQCSGAPVLLLILLHQVSYEILQWTQPQIITDKLGKCTLGCLTYDYIRGQRQMIHLLHVLKIHICPDKKRSTSE